MTLSAFCTGTNGNGSSHDVSSSSSSTLGASHLADDSFDDEEAVNETLAQLLLVMEKLDDRIAPMLEQDGRFFNRRWGFLQALRLNNRVL